MIRALLDTDTFIALLRGARDIRKRIQARPVQSLGVSMITVFELRVGIEKGREPEKSAKFLQDTLAPFTVLAFDDPASAQAAKVRAHLERSGKGIGPYDTLIAGACSLPEHGTDHGEHGRIFPGAGAEIGKLGVPVLKSTIPRRRPARPAIFLRSLPGRGTPIL